MNNKSLQTLQKLVVLLSKTSGRDQTCRLLQYFFMYLVNTTTPDTVLQKKYQAVQQQMNQTRKILRFGRPIGIILSTIQSIHVYMAAHDKDPSNKAHNLAWVINNAIANLFSCLYFLTDHVLWFCNIGVILRPELKKLSDYYGDFFWIWESVFGCIASAIEIFILNKKNSIILTSLSNNQTSKSFDEKVGDSNIIKKQISQAYKDFIKIFLNIFMAMGFTYGTINRKKIGVLGTITSLIGCHQVWIQ